MTTMSKVASISKWLKVEYYSHIKWQRLYLKYSTN
jgi:hypothetical protein